MRYWLKFTLILIAAFCVLAATNWLIQVYRNPAILMSLFSGDRFKSSHTTWEIYQDLFEEHATPTITPLFLAALAQVESAGNPLVIPQWEWRLTTDLTRIYAPASTSAGLYQYTRATFKDAKRFCIHNHRVALQKSLPDLSGCWFNGFYSRFWPSHAIEMTAARLDFYVERIIRQYNLGEVLLADKQKLAAIIHLCGVYKGGQFARTGFDFSRLNQCGSHDTKDYFHRIQRTMSRIGSVSGNFFRKFF